MRKFCFRVDGGSIYSVATGHITRCLKTARYLKARGEQDFVFFMRDYPEGIRLVEPEFKVIRLPKDIPIEDEIQLMGPEFNKNTFFFCDIRNLTQKYIDAVRSACRKFILFDDLSVKNLQPDILINPTPFSYLNYNTKVCVHTKLLLGEEYFFVSDHLVKQARKRDFSKDHFNILASFGGADPCNITEYFLNEIVPLLTPHTVTVVLGPAYKLAAEVQVKYASLKNVKFVVGPKNLDDLFLSNDIAFVCGGDTCIESCCSGAATFVISSISYEKQCAEILSARNMVVFATDIEDIKAGRVNKKFMDLIKKSEPRLKAISDQGMVLVDGSGLKKIYDALMEGEINVAK
ncbi:MAG: hypothetical protein HQL25_02535 [Candidatus Omnitrophica bacterium]|nr:hypothetical protein [Candidatus Omnitrophota bacterium]